MGRGWLERADLGEWGIPGRIAEDVMVEAAGIEPASASPLPQVLHA